MVCRKWGLLIDFGNWATVGLKCQAGVLISGCHWSKVNAIDKIMLTVRWLTVFSASGHVIGDRLMEKSNPAVRQPSIALAVGEE